MLQKNFKRELAQSILKNIPLFSSFSAEELSILLDKSSFRSYSKDQIIIMSEEEEKQMYVVLSGQIRVVKISIDGEERVMAFRHRGDFFGDMGMLDNQTDSATVIANDTCKVILITKPVFDEFFLSNKKSLLIVVETLCGRLRESWLFQTIVGHNNAESKIRATLAHYSKTLGIQNATGIIINSTFSHQSIADRVHITRETVTRVLNKMRARKEIEMVGRRFKLLHPFFESYEKTELFKILGMDIKKH